MFHHLGADEKEKTLGEMRRVLKPGGSLHIADFAGAEARAKGWLARLLHSSHRLKDNSESLILALMKQAWLVQSSKVTESAVLFGHLHISYYRAIATCR
jgi:ubiquinone/menaquinone biosynthesis C-methylase UbiE